MSDYTPPQKVTSVSNTDGTLTVSPTTGAVEASIDTSHSTSWTAVQSFTKGISTGGGGTAPTAVTVPASGTAYTPSTTGNTVLFVSGGTVTAVAVNGITTGLTSGTFYMKANDTITFTYTAAPTVYQMGG